MLRSFNVIVDADFCSGATPPGRKALPGKAFSKGRSISSNSSRRDRPKRRMILSFQRRHHLGDGQRVVRSIAQNHIRFAKDVPNSQRSTMPDTGLDLGFVPAADTAALRATAVP